MGILDTNYQDQRLTASQKKKIKPVIQGGGYNYLGEQEEVTVPKKWLSDPDHVVAELAYITPREKKVLIDLNMYGSLDGKPNNAPGGLPSLQGDMGSVGGGGRSSGGGGGSSGGGGGGGGRDYSPPSRPSTPSAPPSKPSTPSTPSAPPGGGGRDSGAEEAARQAAIAQEAANREAVREAARQEAARQELAREEASKSISLGTEDIMSGYDDFAVGKPYVEVSTSPVAPPSILNPPTNDSENLVDPGFVRALDEQARRQADPVFGDPDPYIDTPIEERDTITSFLDNYRANVASNPFELGLIGALKTLYQTGQAREMMRGTPGYEFLDYGSGNESTPMGGGGDRDTDTTTQPTTTTPTTTLPPSMVNQYFANMGDMGNALSSQLQTDYNNAKNSINSILGITPPSQQFGYSADPYGGLMASNLTTNPYNIDYLRRLGLI